MTSVNTRRPQSPSTPPPARTERSESRERTREQPAPARQQPSSPSRGREADRFESQGTRTDPRDTRPPGPWRSRVSQTDEGGVQLETGRREGRNLVTRSMSAEGDTLSGSHTTRDRHGTERSTSGELSSNGASLSRSTERRDGSGHSTSVGVEDGNLTLSGSRTNSTGTTASASLNVGREGVEATGGAEVELSDNLSFSFETTVGRTQKRESENGFTTSTYESTVKVEAGGEAQLGPVGLGASGSGGAQRTYEVRMRDADQARVDSGQAPKPDPYHPQTLPEGSSVRIDSSTFRGYSTEASYRGAQVSEERTQEQGTSRLIERTGPNTVRVTVGPTEAIENKFELGLTAGPAHASLSNTTQVDSNQLRTAEFDISTPQGLAAYNRSMATGTLPTQNGPGVSNVSTTRNLEVSSTTSGSLGLGPLSLALNDNSNRVNQTETTKPDGSRERLTQINYGSGVPVNVEQHFRPDGSEDTGKQRYTIPLQDVPAPTAQMLYAAFTGDREGARRLDTSGDRQVDISLTRDQVSQLQERAREYVQQRGPGWNSHGAPLISRLAQAQTPEEAMVAISRGIHGPSDFASDMYSLANGAQRSSTLRDLPGSVTVK